MRNGAQTILKDLAQVIDRRAQPITRDMDMIAAANRSLTVGELAAAQIGADGLPQDVFDFYFSILSRVQRRNQALLAQLREVGKALNREGICAILLKGSAELATRGETLPRLISDLDLMVSSLEVDGAMRALSSIGFEVQEGGGPAAGATLARSKDVGAIDLHTSLKAGLPSLSYDAIKGASERIALDGATFLLPSEVVRVAVFVVHDQLQERDYWTGAIDLRHLHDLARLSRSFDDEDWNELASYFPSGFERRALRTQLATLAELFGPLPHELPGEDFRVRMQVRRRLAQVAWPWLRLPMTLISLIADPPRRAQVGSLAVVASSNRRLRKATGKYLQRRRLGKY